MEDGIGKLLELRNSHVFLPCRKIERVRKLQNCSNKFGKNFSYLILYDTYYMMRWNGIM